MAIADTKVTAKGLRATDSQGISLTGLANSTAYTGEITYPTGRVQTVSFSSDGSGNATISGITSWEPGTHTLVVKTVPAVAYTTTWKA